MSDCLHCDIHELLDSELEGKEANLAEKSVDFAHYEYFSPLDFEFGRS
jgi:hypothetical protein